MDRSTIRWQHAAMGNKDAKRREKRKPKQNKPKKEDSNQLAYRIVKQSTN
jgi:hypothetical protein